MRETLIHPSMLFVKPSKQVGSLSQCFAFIVFTHVRISRRPLCLWNVWWDQMVNSLYSHRTITSKSFILQFFLPVTHSHLHSYSVSMGSTFSKSTEQLSGAIWSSVSCPRTLRHVDGVCVCMCMFMLGRVVCVFNHVMCYCISPLLF